MERLKEPEFFLKTRDILDRYPKENGRFYCGCSKNVTKLLPSEITGEIRSGEEERRGFRDVIFLTKNFQKANEYAGSEGVIFEVKTDAVQYKLVAIDVLNPKKAKALAKIFILHYQKILK